MTSELANPPFSFNPTITWFGHHEYCESKFGSGFLRPRLLRGLKGHFLKLVGCTYISVLVQNMNLFS